MISVRTAEDRVLCVLVGTLEKANVEQSRMVITREKNILALDATAAILFATFTTNYRHISLIIIAGCIFQSW